MKGVSLKAQWAPRPGFVLGAKDREGKLTYLGNQVWKNPVLEIVDKPKPKLGETEVLIEVKACGICGSDVHMAQPDDEGYIFYPGLTAFPAILGHEFSGIVVDSGKNAINKRTNARYEPGEPVTAEEMLWCGTCRPCVDGYPNHCERLEELGFSCDGAMAEYVKVDAKYCWSLKGLEADYSGQDLFKAGSLVEPTSVAYNAVIERAGGIRPGDNVVIVGGGPIGQAASAILKRAGAAHVILSEPSPTRRDLAGRMGATDLVDPTKRDFADAVLEITKGEGASLYLEGSGLFERVWPGIEKCIWEGKALNAVVALVARAPQKAPMTPEVFQVRRASIVGSQGHSGHGTFPRVISAMASGMDMTPMITKTISLEEAPENIVLLRTDRKECKITILR
jgi:threonine dehydrogenase-like Zn-dependent dehydrogenase